MYAIVVVCDGVYISDWYNFQLFLIIVEEVFTNEFKFASSLVYCMQ